MAKRVLKIFGHPTSGDRNNNIGAVLLATVSSIEEFEEVIEKSVSRGNKNRYLSYAIFEGKAKIQECSRTVAESFLLTNS